MISRSTPSGLVITGLLAAFVAYPGVTPAPVHMAAEPLSETLPLADILPPEPPEGYLTDSVALVVPGEWHVVEQSGLTGSAYLIDDDDDSTQEPPQEPPQADEPNDEHVPLMQQRKDDVDLLHSEVENLKRMLQRQRLDMLDVYAIESGWHDGKMPDDTGEQATYREWLDLRVTFESKQPAPGGSR